MITNIKTRRSPSNATDVAGRRRSIIEAAAAVIARHGLSGTTIERVAAEARVSPGTVMFHFDKESLLVATMDQVAQDFEAARAAAIAAAGDDPARALEALIEVSFDRRVSEPRRVAVWYAFWGEARARQVYMDRVGRLDAAYQADLVRLCRDLAARVGAPAHIDPEAVALGFAGLADGLWEEILTAGRNFDRKRAVRLCRSYLASVFPGQFAPRDDESTASKDKREYVF
jgi:AcrR family transcriptional regulator